MLIALLPDRFDQRYGFTAVNLQGNVDACPFARKPEHELLGNDRVAAVIAKA
jgi:hypothetical protein